MPQKRPRNISVFVSTHASRSTSRRGAVLERLGPFGAACFSQGRVVDHRRALAGTPGSQRACDASQLSACICVGSVCSGAGRLAIFLRNASLDFSSDAHVQRIHMPNGPVEFAALQNTRSRDACVPPLRRCQAPNLALTSQSQWSQQQRPLRVVRGGLRPPPTARVTARSFRDQTRPDSVRVGLRAPSFSLLS